MESTLHTIHLLNGWTLESGPEPDSDLSCGDWVSIICPRGDEYLYWYWTEWEEEPQSVMGAFLNAARKYSTYSQGEESAPDVCKIPLANGKVLSTGHDPNCSEDDYAYGHWVQVSSPEGDKTWNWTEWQADPRRTMRDIFMACQ